MNYRLTTLLAQKAFTADGTEIMELNVRDPISHLVIELAYTNADGTMDGPPAGLVTKIELVDGSDVLFSTTALCAEAVDWYQQGGQTRANYNYFMTGTGNRFVVVNFGRYWWDEVLALVPDRFRNLQLRVTIDIDCGGSSVSSLGIEVWAGMFDQKDISPIGFLQTKEVKAYTAIASGYEYTDMPLDYPYRAMYVQALVAGTEPNQLINGFKLDEDNDKRIVFDEKANVLLRTMVENNRPCEEHFYCTMTNANQYKYCMPTTMVYASANEWDESPGAGDISLYDGDGGRLKTITETGASNAMVRCVGHAPNGLFSIPFGKRDDIDDWYDVSGIGNLRLRLKATASMSSTARILAEQLRRY